MSGQQWISRSDRSKENLPQDVISWLVKAIEDNDQSAPPGLQALNEDGRLMIIAGRYTTTLVEALTTTITTIKPQSNLI